MTRSYDQELSKLLGDSIFCVLLLNIQSLRHETDELFLLLEVINFPEIILAKY